LKCLPETNTSLFGLVVIDGEKKFFDIGTRLELELVSGGGETL